MKLVCVYRESPEFPIESVRVFSNVFQHYHPDLKQVCLTDFRGHLPASIERAEFIQTVLSNQNPWFRKLELFNPDLIQDDLFYVDLDNLIIQDLSVFFDYHYQNPHTPFMIDDVNRSLDRLQSAVMYIPHDKKELVWNRITDGSGKINLKILDEAGIFGDAKVIRDSTRYISQCQSYQKVFGINSIISYRLSWLRSKDRDHTTRIICMHGKTEKPIHKKFNHSNKLIADHYLRWL